MKPHSDHPFEFTKSGPPNLDCMSPQDLTAFSDYHRHGWNSHKLFPDQRYCKRATANLAKYASSKCKAIGCRVMGDIATALDYEATCDRIYKRLPHFARW